MFGGRNDIGEGVRVRSAESFFSSYKLNRSVNISRIASSDRPTSRESEHAAKVINSDQSNLYRSSLRLKN